ncbi:hypothetical protein HNP46_000260 [Pseudomonas nitritireducens]|uniref:Uncharacterized protein n=1 Tax=Pseudomonas nitroreducens TaxID=46680 RepID=A0A7W7KER0_PSENT|nr:hypothetical protein [Pseudomonas nitritireducens]MBB4861449.1 hypothetical protein [Pseudomonas nitritireducens]
MTTKANLEEMVKDLDALTHLECDGLSHQIVHRLTTLGVSCQLFSGIVTLGNHVVRPHYWVVVGDLIIDYRVRRWMQNDPEAPHGVFHPAETDAEYDGIEAKKLTLPTGLMEFLAIPDDVFLAKLAEQTGMNFKD